MSVQSLYVTRGALVFVLIVVALSASMVSNALLHASSDSGTHYIKIMPGEPTSLSPVIVLVKYHDKVVLRASIIFNVSVEVSYNVGVHSSSGARILTVSVTRHGVPVSGAYVVLYGLLGSVYGSGYTSADGKIVFRVNPGDYVVRVFYDSNGNGLYDMYGSASVKVGLFTDAQVSIEIQRLSRILGIREVAGYYDVPVLRLKQNLYITAMPGLPALTIQTPLTVKGVLPSITNASISMRPVVTLYLYNRFSELVDMLTYEVKPLEYSKNMRPLVLSFIDDALNNTELWYETLGLSPWGWSTSSNNSIVVDVLVVDDKGVEDIGLMTCTFSECSSVSLHPHPFMEKLAAMLNNTSKIVDTILGELGALGLDLGLGNYRPKIPLYLYQSTPLSLVEGKPVFYYAYAIDVDGNFATSPMGLIHVYTPKPKARVLVIDPHIKLWVMARNAENILENTADNPYGNLFYEIMGDNEYYQGRLKKILKVLENARWFTRYHYWSSILGEDYEFKIIWPTSDLGKVLEEYKPDVIVLSNLYLGVNGLELLNWDLRSLGALKELVDYVQQHHVGLIVTHGTLSDLYIWYDTGEYYRIGSRGHVGYNISDVGLLSDDFVEEKVVSTMVGLRWLPLLEDIRDRIAYTLCVMGESVSKTNPTLGYSIKTMGLIVGSTPLQIPFIPWDGILYPGPDSAEIGLNTTILVEIPNPYQEVNETYRAYTQFGWQLGSIKVLYNVLLHRLNSTSSLVGELYGNLSQLITSLGGHKNIDMNKRIVGSISTELPKLVNAISSLKLVKDRVVVTDIPQFKLLKELTGARHLIEIDLHDRLKELILRYYPVKLFAISPDGLAGIIGYDKFWDKEKGYRSVYFSFEVEACTVYDCDLMFRKALEWTRSWKYIDVLGIVEGLLVNKSSKAWSMLKKFSEAPGYTISTILSSNSTLSLTLDEEASKIKLLVYSPFGIEELVFNPKPSKVNILDDYTVIVEYTKPIANVEVSSANEVLLQPLLVRVTYTYATTPITPTTTTRTTVTATPLTKYIYTTITTTKTRIVTLSYTTTKTKIIRQVETETRTLTVTKPTTTITTIYKETTTTITSTKTTTTTHTITLRVVDYNLTAIVAIIAFAIGFTAVFMAKRR